MYLGGLPIRCPSSVLSAEKLVDSLTLLAECCNKSHREHLNDNGRKQYKENIPCTWPEVHYKKTEIDCVDVVKWCLYCKIVLSQLKQTSWMLRFGSAIQFSILKLSSECPQSMRTLPISIRKLNHLIHPLYDSRKETGFSRPVQSMTHPINGRLCTSWSNR